MTSHALATRTVPCAAHPTSAARATSRLRVMQVINSLVVGGAEQLLVTLAQHIDTDRYDLRVCSLSPLNGTPIERDLRALAVPVYSVSETTPHDARHVVRLAALARRLNVDVLHTHLPYANTIGTLAGAATRRPVVSTLHNVRSVHNPYNWDGRLKEGLQTCLLRYGVRTVIACAPEVRAMATGELGLLPRHVVDIPNGIDTVAVAAVFPAEAAARRAELLAGAAGPLVLAVGNLLVAKGHVVLVEAAALLRSRFPGLRVAIVGREGEGAPAVRERIAALGLERHVALVGQRRDVPALLAAADAFGHSMAADAGTAAREAGAGRLLLTHFRARRFADPAALAAEAAFGRPVELARDLGVVDV